MILSNPNNKIQMFEILDFEKCHIVKFGSGKNTGFIVYTFNTSQIRILTGKNTNQEEIPETILDNGVKGKINPTKVFLFVAKVLKRTLCPQCV